MWNILSKFGGLVNKHQKDLFLVVCIVLIAFISHNLGKTNALKKMPITITGQEANIFQAGGSQTSNSGSGVVNPKPQINKSDPRVVGSKNSDKYHHTWCSGVKSIKEENQRWFDSAAAAQAAGYVLAGNCKP